MAEASLSWTAGGTTTILEVDITPTQGFERTAEVTEHPVEAGAPIADHVKLNNGVITLEALITNTPVRIPSTQMQGATRASGTTSTAAGDVTTLRWSGPFDRVRECDALLDSLVAARVVVTLATSLRQIENLILTRYKVDRTTESGRALPATLEFKQIRLATTQRAEVPALRRLQRPATAGTQPADDRSAIARGEDGGARQTAEQVAQARERARIRRLTGRSGT